MTELKFTNGKFKIMQIADVQENYPPNPDTLKLISLAVKKEKPDLVVFTGDQISGYSPCYKKDTENKVKAVISAFLKPITDEGIAFTYTFGNHDDDCKMSKTLQADFYEAQKGCIIGKVHSKNDRGTHFFNIKSSDGKKDIFALYIIDSNKKDKDGGYSSVKKDQLSWLEQVRKDNGHIPALAFQHIPLPEFYDVLKKVPFYKKGAVEAYGNKKNTFWLLEGNDGFMGETPAVPKINSGEFDLLNTGGDILGLFVGHDHNNSFVRHLKNIDLGYTQGAGFNTYGPGDRRGVRIFKLNENDLTAYETYTVTIKELCNYKPSKPLQEFIFRNAPTSTNEVKTDIIRITVAGGIIVGIAWLLSKKLKTENRKLR